MRSKAKRGYIFDLDDTLSITDGVIHTTEGNLTTAQYAARKPALAENPFRSIDDDAAAKCELQRGPCFEKFQKALRDGSSVAIVSARANSKSVERKLVRRLVRQANVGVSAKRVNSYFVNSQAFARLELCMPDAPTPTKKEAAVGHFLQRHPRLEKVGFSDDDKANVARMTKYFRKINKNSDIQFSVFTVSKKRIVRERI